jgi:hypothetical protein
MSSSFFLSALRDLLATQTDKAVAIGRPIEDRQGLWLWPWKLDVRAASHNRPPEGQRGHPSREPEPLPVELHLLVVAVGTPDIDQLQTLETAGQAMQTHPVLEASGKTARVVIENIPTGELTGIFTAAGLSLRLCLACKLESIG